MKKKFYFIFLFSIFLFVLTSCNANDKNIAEASIVETSFTAIESETEKVVDTSFMVTELETEKVVETKVQKKVEELELTIDNILLLDDSKIKTFEEKKIFESIDEYPKVDGSTAMLPLMAKLMEDTCGITKEKSEENTTCSKTAKAWLNLADCIKDLLVVGEPPVDTKWRILERKKQILYAPIRSDGLIFIVNKDNPIDSLTEEELIKIYTGEVANWKELGGNDIEIKAFQRNEDSGSQSNFIKLLMKDVEPTKAEFDKQIPDMGGLVDAIADFDDSDNAIGYSMYYYANYMYTKDNLKMLKVNGVAPTDESIANGTYPLLSKAYVAIRKDTDENSNVKKLYDYIRSDMGKNILKELGYIPVNNEK